MLVQNFFPFNTTMLQHGNFDVNDQGLRLIVGDSCLQAIAYLHRDLFSTFVLREPSIAFRIPLNMLVVSVIKWAVPSNYCPGMC
jgi:hypothetical protein